MRRVLAFLLTICLCQLLEPSPAQQLIVSILEGWQEHIQKGWPYNSQVSTTLVQLSIGATDGIIETGEVLWGGRSLTTTNLEYAAAKLGYAYSAGGQFYSGYHTEWFGTAEEARTM